MGNNYIEIEGHQLLIPDGFEALFPILSRIAEQSAKNVGSYGELVIIGNGQPVGLVLQNTWYKINTQWAISRQNGGTTPSPSDGTITANLAGMYIILTQITTQGAGSAQTFAMSNFKNGNQINGHKSTRAMNGPNTYGSITISGIEILAPGDVIDARIICTSAANQSPVVTDANFLIARIGD